MGANAVKKQVYTGQNQWVQRRLTVVKKADAPASQKYAPQEESTTVDFEEFLKQYGIKSDFA